MSNQRIPITIVTGFLGSGKTTLILNLIPQLPKTYRLALLKNEYGDVAIDSQLASSQAISGVQELLNGCICCNLVGQLSDALEELRTGVVPDRIMIETSGSAFPATLAMEVNRLAKVTGHYVLDGVMSVIDVENWQGYEDTSMTAKVQAQYTDLLILNKHELVSERQLETCIDRILDLELDVPTPRILSQKGFVDKDLVFGLDAKLASLSGDSNLTNGEHKHDHAHGHGHSHDGHQSEIEVLNVSLSGPEGAGVDLEKLEELLREAPKDEVYRIKAVLYAKTAPVSSTGERAAAPNAGESGRYILNWAFGRWTFTAAALTDQNSAATEPVVRMTIMTARGESARWKRAIERDGSITLVGDHTTGELTIDKIG